MARESKVSLAGSNFHSKDLRGVNFSDMDLTGSCFAHSKIDNAVCDRARFDSADLQNLASSNTSYKQAAFICANLRDAIMQNCDFTDARILRSNCVGLGLEGSDMRGASLDGSILTNAKIACTLLVGTYLGSIDLRSCDLSPIRDDFFGLLAGAPAMAPMLAKFLRSGSVRAYQLTETDRYGMLAKYMMGNPVSDTSRNFRQDPFRPVELFACGIADGDTPAENQFSAILVEWIEEWLYRIGGAAMVMPYDMAIAGGKVQ